jgi:hypothetical protein
VSRDADGPAPGWARARAVLERLAQSQSAPHSKIEVGRVTKIGDGLSRDAFAAELTAAVTPSRRTTCGFTSWGWPATGTSRRSNRARGKVDHPRSRSRCFAAC